MAANLNPMDIKPDVKKTVNGFGSFKVALADVLTVTTVLQLATFFEYPPVIIEELGTAAGAGLLMIRYMEERGQIKPTSLVSVKSFRDIFDSDIISSNRILLEGDPGYGKSTLTLQAAYDWCLGNVASPLKNVAVCILLPLRLLGNISSIFEAIRFVLMPKESSLTDADILDILKHSLSVVIVLDGYDEYPDKNSGKETDVINMIAGKMFPNVKVVVSSRSSSLTKYLDPTTVTIRLTGFDEKSRDEYIDRPVTGGDQEASRRITNALNSSPILNDICQVPIFCVLFNHVANDQQGVIEFSSVTSFFKYVIDCFYSHMWKKDLKETIQESIRDYSKLNRLEFDGLTGKTQMIAWPKRTFIDTVGNGCY
ncbi:putative NLR family CARD domain-containing protein 4 [Apostichopus japonicus]|uniref:Putative NLR family CARD domain-containing protein 4 n=1 Tax=Stichopus japonicus TaxID=307972 RepID=A0A2G8JGK5_STIJA|nr:putative NLR family CARD domain-containing protein 4 [Apostichopus japonicus]